MAPLGLMEVTSFIGGGGVLGTGKPNFGGVIGNSQCCDLANFSGTNLSNEQLSKSTLTSPRSGLVLVYWPE